MQQIDTVSKGRVPVMMEAWTCSLYVWMSISLFCTGETTPCTDAAAVHDFSYVNRMCQSSTVLSTRVAVDTYDTGSLGYSSCTCTTRLHGGTLTSNTKVTVESYPGTSPQAQCGSTLKISSTTTNGFTEIGCHTLTSKPFDNFNSNDTLALVLSRTDESTAWQSGYCILLTLDQQNETSYFLNLTCVVPSSTPATSPTTSTTTSPTTTTITTKITTTTTSTTKTTTKPTIPARTNPTSPTTSETGSSVYTTTVQDTTEAPQTSEIGLEIIIGAAAGGVVLIIIVIIVIIVVVRKKKPNIKKPDSKTVDDFLGDDIQPYSTTNNAFHGDNEETVTPNSLYVSAGPRDPETSHIVTGTGDVYAQVQKTSERTKSQGSDPNNIEMESPQPDVYAVVNKPKKNKDMNGDIDENNKQHSQYKNQDGLVYSEVDVKNRSSSKRSPPPISPKPNMADRVVYSDIIKS